MSKKKVVVLLSGGIDSVTALYQAAKDYEVVATLSFHYGSKHNDKELPMAKWRTTSAGESLKFEATLFGNSAERLEPLSRVRVTEQRN